MIADRILNIIGEELPHARKLAFMPYKAEMWDSLESTYREAVRRGYECRIIPMDYKTKTDDVRHIDFKKSSRLEYWRPDAIFFHNPYDDNNKVTEVNPEYFTENLKEIAPLIYIPYFGNDCGDHFVNQPGIKNAHIVFCDSEDNRQLYLKYFPDTKVYAVGNPKLDTLRFYEEVGKQFKPFVKGAFQTSHITLFASGLMPFMRDPLGKLEEYRYSITREAERGLVVFRPHPLMEPTIETLLTQGMLREWQDFKAEILLNEFVIQDKVSLPEVAMGLSDKLITDHGSLEDLWRYTGKEMEVLE